LPEGWADDLKSQDFVPPDGEPPRLDPNGLAERMAVARQRFLKTQQAGMKTERLGMNETFNSGRPECRDWIVFSDQQMGQQNLIPEIGISYQCPREDE